MPKFIRALAARSVSAIGSLAIVLVLAKTFGGEALGVFAVAHAFFVAGSLLATWGAGNALMKFVGADAESYATYQIIVFAFKRSLWVGLFFAFVLAISADYLAEVFRMVELGPILVGVAISVPLMTFVRLLSGIYKGLGRPDFGCLLDNGGVLLAMSLLLTVFYYYGIDGFELLLALSYVMSVLLFLFFGVFGLRDFFGRPKNCTKGIEQNDIEFEVARYKLVSNDFLYVNAFSLLMHSGVFILAGLILNKEEVGLLKAAQQIAVAVEFVQMVLNSIYPPMFAKSWFNKDLDQLASHAKSCFVIGFWGAFPFFVLILIFPSWILSLIDPVFYGGGLVLILVATGQMINVLTGASIQILGMTDFSRLMRNISVASYFISTISMVFLLAFFSVIGGALGILIFLALPNVIALLLVKKQVGVSVIPGLSEFISLSKSLPKSVKQVST